MFNINEIIKSSIAATTQVNKYVEFENGEWEMDIQVDEGNQEEQIAELIAMMERLCS